jgi:hypothetical protein
MQYSRHCIIRAHLLLVHLTYGAHLRVKIPLTQSPKDLKRQKAILRDFFYPTELCRFFTFYRRFLYLLILF